MKNIIIFDDNNVRKQLLPITYTRPITKIRVGITTIEEKWQALLGEGTYSYLTASYLKKKFPTTLRSQNLLVAGHVIPTPQLARQALALKSGEAIVDSEGQLIAFNGSAQDFDNHNYATTLAPVEPPHGNQAPVGHFRAQRRGTAQRL